MQAKTILILSLIFSFQVKAELSDEKMFYCFGGVYFSSFRDFLKNQDKNLFKRNIKQGSLACSDEKFDLKKFCRVTSSASCTFLKNKEKHDVKFYWIQEVLGTPDKELITMLKGDIGETNKMLISDMTTQEIRSIKSCSDQIANIIQYKIKDVITEKVLGAVSNLKDIYSDHYEGALTDNKIFNFEKEFDSMAANNLDEFLTIKDDLEALVFEIIMTQLKACSLNDKNKFIQEKKKLCSHSKLKYLGLGLKKACIK